MKLSIKRFDPYLLLLLALCLFALVPLTAPGYFYSAHDGRHSVFYLTMFDASIRDGALWPRWAMHHIQGYGYPTFIIQAPLGFYVAEFFLLLGAGYTLAAKLAWAAGFLAGAWGMYALLRHWLAPRTGMLWHAPALVAALLYTYAPYHLSGMYVRAALNDSLLFAWFPWVLLAFDRLLLAGSAPGWPRRLGLAVLLLAATLLTHTFALLSFTPLLITFVLFRLAQRARGGMLWRATALALAAGLGALLLTSAFLIPLLAEGPYLQQQVYTGNTYDFRNHFVQLGQYFSPFWGFGYSDDPTGANDGMGFQLGLPLLALTLAALPLLARPALRRAEMLYLWLATAALLWFMTPLAAPLWEAAAPLALIQFPWRLLSLAVLTASALGGLVAANLLPEPASVPAHHGVPALALGLLVIFASWGYIGADLQPVEPWREDGRAVFRFEQEHPDMIAYTEWVQEPFTTSPMTADYDSDAYAESNGQAGPLTRLAVIAGQGDILSSYSRGSSAGGVVRMDSPGVVRVHLLYFPGWQATLDGQPAALRVSNPYGLLELDVPPGEHRIDVRMGSTPPRRLGAALSWAAFLVALALIAAPSLRRPQPASAPPSSPRTMT